MKILSKFIFAVIFSCSTFSINNLSAIFLRVVTTDLYGTPTPTDRYLMINPLNNNDVITTNVKHNANQFTIEFIRGKRCVTRQSGHCSIKLGEKSLIADDCGCLKLVDFSGAMIEMLSWDWQHKLSSNDPTADYYKFELQGCYVMLMGEL